MKKLLAPVYLLFATLTACFANDGAYFASGNQLIPITDSDISVKKEVLSITRVNDEYLLVDVAYIFYNDAAAKEVLVGFEAPSPSGDVDGTPVNGAHPFIKEFSVMVNNQMLEYQTAIVSDSNYYVNGAFNSKTEQEVVSDPDFEMNYVDFYYVYYFNAKFKKGTNKINHRYKFKISGSNDVEYSFDYILTAANRWENNQIDDFTLIIDLGEFQEYYIENNFFDTGDEWNVNGKTSPHEPMFSDSELTHFYVNNGPIIFKKKNFKPEGELVLHAPFYWYFELDMESFEYENGKLPFVLVDSEATVKQGDEKSLKILRNLPYARRGYIFKTAYIQEFYESMDWYTPNSKYKADYAKLTEEEKEWLKKIKVEMPEDQ